MERLYFKFGAMGSSKTASALMCRFNYMQKGKNVLLLRPSLDTRSNKGEITSRIGLSAPCICFDEKENLLQIFAENNKKKPVDVVIVDECQLCTKKHVDQLREITNFVPVLCYGLKTNFKGELFEASKRLLEISDSLSEIKSICGCGRKAIMNGRFNKNIMVIEGNEIEIGGDEKYKGLCFSCFHKEWKRAEKLKLVEKYIKIFKEKKEFGVWSSDTTADNIILQKPTVVYGKEASNFISEFGSNATILFDEDVNLTTLKKVDTKNKSAEEIFGLIALAIKTEKEKCGLLKSLIEEGVMLKWLKNLKTILTNQEI